MRTTLDIDEDILQAAKELAALRRTSTGKVLSELARTGLRPLSDPPAVRNGVPLLPARPSEQPVTTELVNRLREEE
ncbi:CopG family transcriptional regulator [Acidobacteria bacterium AH-259-L09]|nr:CopG family transcriptional regulator [Acidobacteria bacterium AH-259-L09]